jgi:hypothetical protein
MGNQWFGSKMIWGHGSAGALRAKSKPQRKHSHLARKTSTFSFKDLKDLKRRCR